MCAAPEYLTAKKFILGKLKIIQAVVFSQTAVSKKLNNEKNIFYFDTYDEKKLDFPIRYSRLIDGKHEKPKELSKAINTGTQLNHPFIAPDESYLI